MFRNTKIMKKKLAIPLLISLLLARPLLPRAVVLQCVHTVFIYERDTILIMHNAILHTINLHNRTNISPSARVRASVCACVNFKRMVTKLKLVFYAPMIYYCPAACYIALSDWLAMLLCVFDLFVHIYVFQIHDI